MPDSIHSEYDEDAPTLRLSEEDFLEEHDDRHTGTASSRSKERLLAGSRAAVRGLFGAQSGDADSRRLLKSVRPDRKGKKRSKGRRRGDGEYKDDLDDEEDPSLVFEMVGDEDRDDASDVSETEHFIPSTETRSSRRRRAFRIIAISLALTAMFLLFLFGAWKMTDKTDAPYVAATLSNGTSLFAPTTILISLDGFRADFLDRGITPTLKSFIAQGVSPKYMLPSFPSVTFPNHWTLVTGLHPESHGVVGNSFWDPHLEREFYYTDPERSMQPEWWSSTGAEPLWSTCEKQNVRSAVHMWPGSEAHVSPDPVTLDKFNATEVLPRKVARVLELLDRPSALDRDGDDKGAKIAAADARPQFIAMYVPNVDAHGHLYGPNSTQTRDTIGKVDAMLEGLFDGLKTRNLTDVVNVIVVSDHGMATTSTDRLVQLEDLIDVSKIEHMDGWPLYGLRPKNDADVQPLYEQLSAAATADPAHSDRFDVYLRRENMPARWHFAASDRIAPLWVVPRAGWAVVHKADFDVATAKKTGAVYHPRGLHGYDNEHPLMRAIFVARGPAFPHVPNSRVPVFQNTEVYNIVCDSLGVEGRPNNGTLRLPLKTQGLHSEPEPGKADQGKDDDEKPVDMPPYTPSVSPTSSTAPSSSVPAASPSGTLRPNNKEEEGEKGEEKAGEKTSKKPNNEDGKDKDDDDDDADPDFDNLGDEGESKDEGEYDEDEGDTHIGFLWRWFKDKFEKAKAWMSGLFKHKPQKNGVEDEDSKKQKREKRRR